MRTLQFLLCEDADHAAAVDQMIMDRLRERDGARGSSWSGVFVDYGTPTHYAVLWAAPASELFGQPFNAETQEGDPAIIVIDGEMIQRDASGAFVSGNWERYVPPAPTEESQP